MKAIMSQQIILKRIVGRWLGLPKQKANITVVDSNCVNSNYRYLLNVYGYNVTLHISTEGALKAQLWAFGRVAITRSNIGGLLELINNCKCWAQEEGK